MSSSKGFEAPPPQYMEKDRDYNEDSPSKSFEDADNSSSSIDSEDEREAQAEEEVIIEETTRWIPRQPPAPGARSAVLQKPVVIPRIDAGSILKGPMPFLRAYSPVLQQHDINEVDFLAFIDNLAVAQAQPAPFQVMKAAGDIIGFVPHEWAIFTSIGLGTAAGLGAAAFIYIRTKRFMEVVNRDFFAPRGLKVSLCKDKDLAEKLRLPESSYQILDNTDEAFQGVRDKRMSVLEPYIAPLTTDVPPPTQQKNVLDKISARQVQMRIARRNRKGLKKERKTAEKHAKVEGKKAEREGEIVELEQKLGQLHLKLEKAQSQKDARKVQEDISDLEKKLAKRRGKLERKMAKWDERAEERKDKAEEKQNKKAGRLGYILVENLEQGA